jgi:hypothetical protein
VAETKSIHSRKCSLLHVGCHLLALEKQSLSFEGAVIDVHDYIKKILFPFSMFQVIIIINTYNVFFLDDIMSWVFFFMS